MRLLTGTVDTITVKHDSRFRISIFKMGLKIVLTESMKAGSAVDSEHQIQ